MSVQPPLTVYRQTAQARQQARRAAVEARRQRALQLAQQSAALLRSEFGAGQVAAFGSLVQPALFHPHSDIDLAVWGLEERLYFRAVGVLQGLDAAFSIDLIAFEDAAPSLQETIQREGVLL